MIHSISLRQVHKGYLDKKIVYGRMRKEDYYSKRSNLQVWIYCGLFLGELRLFFF